MEEGRRKSKEEKQRVSTEGRKNSRELRCVSGCEKKYEERNAKEEKRRERAHERRQEEKQKWKMGNESLKDR